MAKRKANSQPDSMALADEAPAPGELIGIHQVLFRMFGNRSSAPSKVLAVPHYEGQMVSVEKFARCAYSTAPLADGRRSLPWLVEAKGAGKIETFHPGLPYWMTPDEAEQAARDMSAIVEGQFCGSVLWLLTAKGDGIAYPGCPEQASRRFGWILLVRPCRIDHVVCLPKDYQLCLTGVV